ncbi:MAG: hypothetical protein J5807_00310 [Kiritimatiellae bacterium]|nr:hypothetical protein [Kiritimatiellia bacterium]
MLSTMALLAAAATVNFGNDIGQVRPELHGSGFAPQICSCSKESVDLIRSMGFSACRTHDWALTNPNQRVCDYFHIFPLINLDANDPKNYVFGPTDYLLGRARNELGADIFFRLGTSIEHSGPKVHFNSLIPEDFDKVADVFAGIVRHYNKGWANGKEWGIKYWEIWNEPDGHNNMWCLPDGDGNNFYKTKEDKADYEARRTKRERLFAEFYAKCIKRIKGEFPEVKVGGPALCYYNEKYFAALLEECKKQGVAPDFISWHHYTHDPDIILKSAEKARKFCDEMGFPNCELIVNEWHYFGKHYSWGDLRSSDPAKRAKAWEGPGSHNGIESSCFNLTALAGMQTSKLAQAYYYGCMYTGAWGFMDGGRNLYKVYYGLKLFGDLVKKYKTICESTCDGKGITALALKSADGSQRAVLVIDYGAKAKSIELGVAGVPEGAKAKAWIHDYKRNFEPVPAKAGADGKIVLEKADENSAAFLVTFE